MEWLMNIPLMHLFILHMNSVKIDVMKKVVTFSGPFCSLSMFYSP